METLRRLLFASQSHRANDAQYQRLRKTLILVGMFLFVGSMIQALIDPFTDRRAMAYWDGAFSVTGLIATLLVLSHRPRLALIVGITGIYSLAVIEIYLFGNVRDFAYYFIVGCLVFVGIFYSRRTLIAVTVLTILLMGLLTYLQAHGMLFRVPNQRVNLQDWFTVTALLSGIGVVCYYQRAVVNNTLQLHQAALQSAEQGALEQARVQERFDRLLHRAPCPTLLQHAFSGEIVDANEAFEKLLLVRKQDLVGKTDGHLYALGDKHAGEDAQHSMSLQLHTDIVTEMRCGNGNIIRTRQISYFLEDEKEPMKVTFILGLI